MTGGRTFEVVSVNGKSVNKGGHYTGANHMSAAKKAYSKLIVKPKRSKGKKSVSRSPAKSSASMIIVMREMTQGSDHKELTYKVKRHALKSPKKVMKDDTAVYFYFETIAKAMK
jgi:hypothetical protein